MPLAFIALLFVVVFVAAGCGDSEPEFCSKSDDLQESLDTLKSDVKSGDVSAIRSDAGTVRSDVREVDDSAKSDFPRETKAIRTSFSTLNSTISALPSSPSTSDLIDLAADVTAAAAAVSDFKAATSSECD